MTFKGHNYGNCKKCGKFHKSNSNKDKHWKLSEKTKLLYII